MAAKKDSTPVLEEPVKEEANEAAKLEEMQKRLQELEKENAQLKKNSVYSPSPFGGAQDFERVKAACQQAAEDGADPWGIKISVNAPRIGKGEDSYWLCVNGRTIQVPANDRYFELALPFADCLVDEIENRKRANDYIDSIQVYDPDSNPKPAK